MNGKTITLFAGIGGTSLGLKQAGMEEVLAIDWLDLSKYWKLNFPGIDFWKVDIMSITGNDILDRIGMRVGEAGCLTASPPCQGFSSSGNFDVNDERNLLFFKTIDILNEVMPATFMFENVCGIIKGKMRGIFKDLFERMSLNYNVRVQRMNSMYYGCATSRPRIIWLGARKDLDGSIGLPKHQKVLAVKDVLDGVEPRTYKSLSPKFEKMWERTPVGRKFNIFLESNKYFSYHKVNPFLPCPTIARSPFKLLHWAEPRSLSIEELKRIASFPDDFQLGESASFQWNMIGNAVMPNFSGAIFGEVRKFLDNL